ncbi:GrpE protein-like protein, mitochondrial [Backusella circina FSU 941]|nr:GrpE protein-like protein, mitochondrial [Backusella circina FSU 941]
MFSFSVIRSTAIKTTSKYSRANRILPVCYQAYTTSNNGEPTKEPSDEGQQSKEETDIPNDIKSQLLEKDKKIAELQDAYIRSLADQENIRERSRKESETTKEYAIQKFAKDLLDTVDILNMALGAVPEELRKKETAEKSDKNTLVDQLTNLYMGVSMTETELIKALKRHGVERFIPKEGEPFDHNKHQALFQTPMSGKTPGTIFSVEKMGYTLKGRILRPAHVGVVADPQ